MASWISARSSSGVREREYLVFFVFFGLAVLEAVVLDLRAFFMGLAMSCFGLEGLGVGCRGFGVAFEGFEVGLVVSLVLVVVVVVDAAFVGLLFFTV